MEIKEREGREIGGKEQRCEREERRKREEKGSKRERG